jgi:hypothetical protein
LHLGHTNHKKSPADLPTQSSAQVNKPTDPWENPNKKTVQKLFAIGAKASEGDFDRKSRYIKYICWGISILLFIGFLSIL